MNFFVAVTDYDWFQLHASRVEEVNFRPPFEERKEAELMSSEEIGVV